MHAVCGDVCAKSGHCAGLQKLHCNTAARCLGGCLVHIPREASAVYVDLAGVQLHHAADNACFTEHLLAITAGQGCSHSGVAEAGCKRAHVRQGCAGVLPVNTAWVWVKLQPGWRVLRAKPAAFLMSIRCHQACRSWSRRIVYRDGCCADVVDFHSVYPTPVLVVSKVVCKRVHGWASTRSELFYDVFGYGVISRCEP